MDNNARTCGITGANGYVGSVLLGALQRAGWNVIALGRHPLSLPLVKNRYFSFEDDNTALDLSAMDALLHCAYDFRPTTWRDVERQNIFGTRRLLEAARRDGVHRILSLSTISAFEGCISMYGRAKLAIEQLTKEHGGTIVRPGLVFGKHRGGMIAKLERAVHSMPVVPLIDGGNQKQYLVHTADLGHVIVSLLGLEDARETSIVTAAHDVPKTLREILETIAHASETRKHWISVPSGLVKNVLRMAEQWHMPTPFRYDSLVSLLSQNPAPDFSVSRMHHFSFRPFSVETWESDI